jgi:hypothetical protein
MWLSKFIKWAAFVAGLALATVAAAFVSAARSGAFPGGSAAGFIAGACFLLLALPCLALPFSMTVFRALSIVVLLALSASLLWLLFRPSLAPKKPEIYQFGAVALAVLFVARLGLRIRRRRTRLDV